MGEGSPGSLGSSRREREGGREGANTGAQWRPEQAWERHRTGVEEASYSGIHFRMPVYEHYRIG